MVWRDVKVKYKQTLLGMAWAVIQPVMTMLIFTFLFGKVAKLPTEGIPYPVFSFTAFCRGACLSLRSIRAAARWWRTTTW